MKHLLTSLESALNSGNYYGALLIALTLPDICGWIEDPTQYSKARYISWFEKYLKTIYTRPASRILPEHVFLDGSDFYALRCAYLHEGRDDIVDQKARKVLERFHFVVPPIGWQVHCNQLDDTLQLQVDIFCRDIAQGTSTFLEDIVSNPDAMQRLSQQLLIRDINGSPF